MSVYMSRADEIMLFVVYLAILGILYGIARNSARRQKGLLFGVTVPETALELPQVQVIIRRFKWETDLLALAMVVVYIPLFFLRTMWLLAVSGSCCSTLPSRCHICPISRPTSR